jgi:VanZ family protein
MGRRWLPPVVWAIIVLISSSISMPAISAPPGADKGAHGLLYLVLGYLSGRALLLGRSARVWHLLVLVVGLLAFGAIDEVHQRWIPTRTADVRDWVADAVGSVAGIATAIVVTRVSTRRAT